MDRIHERIIAYRSFLSIAFVLLLVLGWVPKAQAAPTLANIIGRDRADHDRQPRRPLVRRDDRRRGTDRHPPPQPPPRPARQPPDPHAALRAGARRLRRPRGDRGWPRPTPATRAAREGSPRSAPTAPTVGNVIAGDVLHREGEGERHRRGHLHQLYRRLLPAERSARRRQRRRHRPAQRSHRPPHRPAGARAAPRGAPRQLQPRPALHPRPRQLHELLHQRLPVLPPEHRVAHVRRHPAALSGMPDVAPGPCSPPPTAPATSCAPDQPAGRPQHARAPIPGASPPSRSGTASRRKGTSRRSTA